MPGSILRQFGADFTQTGLNTDNYYVVDDSQHQYILGQAVATMLGQMSTMQQQIATLQAQVATLQQKLTALDFEIVEKPDQM